MVIIFALALGLGCFVGIIELGMLPINLDSLIHTILTSVSGLVINSSRDPLFLHLEPLNYYKIRRAENALIGTVLVLLAHNVIRCIGLRKINPMKSALKGPAFRP